MVLRYVGAVDLVGDEQLALLREFTGHTDDLVVDEYLVGQGRIFADEYAADAGLVLDLQDGVSVLLCDLLVVDHTDDFDVAGVAPGGLYGAGEPEVLSVDEDLLQDVVSAPEIVGEVLDGTYAGTLTGDIRAGNDLQVEVSLDPGLDNLLGSEQSLVAVQEIQHILFGDQEGVL